MIYLISLSRYVFFLNKQFIPYFEKLNSYCVIDIVDIDDKVDKISFLITKIVTNYNKMKQWQPIIYKIYDIIL